MAQKLYTCREFGDKIGVTRQAVQKAIKAGRIKSVAPNERGWICITDCDQALKEWNANTDPSKKKAPTVGQMQDGITTSDEVMDTAGDLVMRDIPKNHKSKNKPKSKPKPKPRQKPKPKPKPAVNKPNKFGPAPMKKYQEVEIDLDDEPEEGVFSNARARREHYDYKLKKQKFERDAGILVEKDPLKQVVFLASKQVCENLMNIPPRVCSNLAAIDDAFEVRTILDQEIRQALESIADGNFNI